MTVVTTVGLALAILEKEGVLIPQSVGRRRKIALDLESCSKPPSLRVRLLIYDKRYR